MVFFLSSVTFWFLFGFLWPYFQVFESRFVAKHCIFKFLCQALLFSFVFKWDELPCHELLIGTYLLSTVNQMSTSSKVLWFLILGRRFSDLCCILSVLIPFQTLTYEQQLTFVCSLWIVLRRLCNAVVIWHFAWCLFHKSFFNTSFTEDDKPVGRLSERRRTSYE